MSAGWCADVILRTTEPLITVSGSVSYDTDNGLAVASFYEWKGVGVSWDAKTGYVAKKCGNMDGIQDDGTKVYWFECSVLPPANPPSVLAGTYRLGTIIWDTSGTFFTGPDYEDVISVVNAIANVIINGVIVDVSGQVVAGRHRVGVIPEPSTASLLGLGLVGLVLTARRRWPPPR